MGGVQFHARSVGLGLTHQHDKGRVRRSGQLELTTIAEARRSAETASQLVTRPSAEPSVGQRRGRRRTRQAPAGRPRLGPARRRWRFGPDRAVRRCRSQRRRRPEPPVAGRRRGLCIERLRSWRFGLHSVGQGCGAGGEDVRHACGRFIPEPLGRVLPVGLDPPRLRLGGLVQRVRPKHVQTAPEPDLTRPHRQLDRWESQVALHDLTGRIGPTRHVAGSVSGPNTFVGKGLS